MERATARRARTPRGIHGTCGRSRPTPVLLRVSAPVISGDVGAVVRGHTFVPTRGVVAAVRAQIVGLGSSSRKSVRAITIRWISLVPSPISQIFASRIIRSTGYSFV